MTEKNFPGSEEARVELRCDDKAVPMNPFVQRFVQETVRGMVRSLEGVPETPETIEIRIGKK